MVGKLGTQEAGAEMKIVTRRARYSYEGFFEKPRFDLGGSPPQTLQKLYDIFAQSYSVSLSNFTVNSNPPLTAFNYEVSLFEGAARITVGLDRFRVDLHAFQAPTDRDVELGLNLVRLTRAAIEDLSPEVAQKHAQVSVSQWFVTEGGADAAQTWLAANAGSKAGKLEKFGAEVVDYRPELRIRNNSELWSAHFAAEKSAVPGSDLFINATNVYIDGGKYTGINERAEHINSLFEVLNDVWGLEKVESL
jgi:hypothetical protein